MDRHTIAALAKGMAPIVREYVQEAVKSAVEPLQIEIAELKSREPIHGKDGTDGEIGPPGPEGPAGREGPPGRDGDPGPRGEKGDPGDKGDPGEVGAQGERGEKGDPGDKGDQGDRGEKGDKGDPGAIDEKLLSAIHESIERSEGSIERLSQEIAVLKQLPVAPKSFFPNERGELVATYPDGSVTVIGKVRGEDGKAGASVMDGAVDDDGQLQLRMSDGRIINAGNVQGPAGRDAKDGERGPPGRDALEIQIIPGIDEGKSYAEGTCARYRGGIIRAERQTDPLEGGELRSAGWAVVLNGIAEETERDLDEGRTIERVTTYTDGTSFTRAHKTPALIYRGLWQQGYFAKGDVVTWGGSQFVAMTDTDAKPETSDDWKLAVKRGRDGKDFKPTDGGPPRNNGVRLR